MDSRSQARNTGLAPEISLFALGVLLGLSQLVSGAYNEATWDPIALGALALALTGAVATRRRPPLGLLLPLVGLWLWSLISSGWADSADNAIQAANRWLLYAAAVAVVWWALDRDRRRGVALMTGAGAGVLGVALWMLVRMLSGHGPDLFLGTRLNDPLGYVNGQAGYLLVGAWPLLALAEGRGTKSGAVVAGLGMFGVVVLVGVGLLAQSRSWEAALVVTLLLLLIGVPGRRRRAAALVVAAGALAAAFTTIAAVWRRPSPHTGLVTVAHHPSRCHRDPAGGGGRGAGVGARRVRARAVRAAGHAGLARAGEGGVGGARGRRHRRDRRARRQRLEHRPPGQAAVQRVRPPLAAGRWSRLFSGAGNRYDYWRVALDEFSSEPFHGVGAGGYQPGYYLHRRTTEAIQQPHSLELQTLAELGIVGGLLLLAFLAAVAAGFVRTVRRTSESRLARTSVGSPR